MKHYQIVLLLLLSNIFLIPCFFIHTSEAQDSTDILDDFNDYEEEDWEIEEAPVIHDPFASYNRLIFKLNDKIIYRILKPISKGYDLLVPKTVQNKINNAFSNIKMPIRFFNNIFQKKFNRASTELGRFAINTTIGLGGLFDPASSTFNLDQNTEDFGQTLGYYGCNTGRYIMWPFLGPSSGRDSIGFIVDLALNPLTWFYILDVEPEDLFTGLSALNHTNNYTYTARDNYNSITEQAIDPYIALQHAYVQNRKKNIEE
ncbi:MAG: VacJ family lipoprotein [Candidatus Saelkia tenebricola]|nr:VacJ family lipoprotein [Candidatus Saelkia tenebricola]